jgi:hypothetical protein
MIRSLLSVLVGIGLIYSQPVAAQGVCPSASNHSY